MSQDERISLVTAVQARYADWLMKFPNVVGVAVGKAKKGGKPTQDMALVVLVEKKMPCEELPPDKCLPTELDGVRVDVQEVGKITAH